MTDAPAAAEPPTPVEPDDQQSGATATARPGAAPRPASRRGLFVTVAVVATCLVAAAGLGLMALRGDSQSSGTGSAGDDAGHGGHAGHADEAVLEGCDPVEYHNTMMMFDPVAADSLLESGCPWPYDATIAVEGGTENPAISAAFEPRRYAEVFDLIGAERYGMCAVKSLSDPSTDGFVFGFEVELNPAGCADGVSTIAVVMREYASRGWRDAAAAVAEVDAAAAGAGDVVVLGRWVVSVIGADRSAVESFSALLVDLGGAPIDG